MPIIIGFFFETRPCQLHLIFAIDIFLTKSVKIIDVTYLKAFDNILIQKPDE